MAAEKTEAIVLRTIEFSETSLIATLFSREFGRLSAMAKGARRAKNAFDNSLDLLSVCHVNVLLRGGDSLHLLTEAKLQRRFRAAARSLEGLYCGYYVAELIRSLTDEGDPHREIFDLIDSTLIAIDQGADLSSTISRFEIRLLAELGSAPSLARCVDCDARVGDQPRAFFGMHAGGVLCTACRPRHRNVVSVRGTALHKIAELMTAESEPKEKNADLIGPEIRGEIRGLLTAYICHCVGHRPKMHEFLKFLA